MKSIKVISLIICLSMCVLAQNAGGATLEGIVTDSKGKTFSGAEVTLVSKKSAEKETVSTDENGFYRFPATIGKFEVTASFTKDGRTSFAEPQTVTLGLDKVVRLDLQLTETAILREEVEVNISAGTSQPFSEVSKSVSVVGAEQIADRNEMALTDAVRTIPGFRVQQLGGIGRTASIKTRGLRNQDTAVLLDGQRLRDPSSITGDASAFISDISLVNVERIEVLRGSGSSVYGTNAIGGVVNVQTRRADRGFSGSVLGEYGGLGLSRFSGQTGYGTRGGKFGFSAGVSRIGVTRGIDREDDANSKSFQGRFDAVPTSRLSFSGKVFRSDSFVRLNASPDTAGVLPANGIIEAVRGVNFVTDANDPDNFQRSEFIAGQISASYIVNAELVISARYQGLNTKRENENGGLGPGFQPFGGTQFSIFDGQVHTAALKIDWTPVRSGRLITGYEYELEKYGNEGIGPTAANAFTTNVDQSSSTFFAQYLQGFLDERLQLAGGFRTQAFTIYSPQFSAGNAPYGGLALSSPPAAFTYDGAASYYFNTSGTKIRVHVGNGYRVPSLYERFGSFYSSFSQSFTVIGDPGLAPEKSTAFDAGVDQNFSNGRLNLSATYFYTRLTDTIGYGNQVRDIGTPRPFGGYENTKGGIARGVELSGSIRPGDSTSLFASYTFTNSDQRRPQVGGSGIIRTLGIPVQQFTFEATRVFGDRLTFNFDFEASSSYLAPIFSNTTFATRIYRFEGNKRGDITGRYALPVLNEKAKTSFFATVENIFGFAYYENGFATAGRTARAGVRFEF